MRDVIKQAQALQAHYHLDECDRVEWYSKPIFRFTFPQLPLTPTRLIRRASLRVEYRLDSLEG